MLTIYRRHLKSWVLCHSGEPKFSDSLSVLMKNIQIPEHVAAGIADSIETDRNNMEATRERELTSLNQRLNQVRTLRDKSFEEKLLGNVDEGVYERKMHQWRR